MTRATLPVLLLAATLASVIPMNAMATDWYVDPVNGSNSNGGASWADAWRTLEYAASTTNGTGTEGNPCVIHLAAGTYSPSSNGETFPVNFGGNDDYCSLIGAGRDLTILSANGSSLVVNSTKAFQVTVTDLMITGGKGGIYHRFGEPGDPQGYFTLERCVISGNTDGCAVETVNDGTVTIRRCIISDNSSDYHCPGLYLTPHSGTLDLTIENCDITNNTLVYPGKDGGGAYVVGCSGRISGCRFAGNSAPEKGGGLLSIGGAGVVENCVFSGNSGGEGGGIYAGWTDRTTFQNCLITDNTCTVDGGGVFVDVMLGFPPSIVQIVNCTIADNQGCGVRLEDKVNEWYSEAYLYNCVICGQDDSVVNIPCSYIHNCDLSDGKCNGENDNICQDPLFVTGPGGDYYLSHAGVNSQNKEDKGK